MADLINAKDDLNEGRKKLNNAIKAFEETIVEGDSSVEAAHARVASDGKTFPTLRDRLNSTDSQLAQKANQKDVRLQDVKLNENDLTEELLQQISGNAPIHSVPNVEGVSAEHLAFRTIPTEKTNFFETSRNIFNIDTIVEGKIVSNTTGNLQDNTSYHTSDYIPVLSSTTYVRSGASTNTAFFDGKKDFISGQEFQEGSFTTPNNAKYMRVSFVRTLGGKLQIEMGSNPTDYTPHNKYINILTVRKKQLDYETTSILSESESLLSRLKTGKNLFNPDKVNVGYIVKHTDGQLQLNATYNTSDYISVEPNTKYSRSNDMYLAFYNQNKVFIQGYATGSGNTTFTTTNATYYIRVTMRANAMGNFQLEKGEVSTPFEPYHMYFEGVGSDSEGVLSGKKGLAFGDSITMGGTYPANISVSTGADYKNFGFGATRLIRYNTPEYPYSQIGMCEIADAISSGDWSYMQSYINDIDVSRGDNVFSTKYNQLKNIDFNEIDFITIMYGTNDLNSILSVGEMDSSDTTTIHGALNHVIQSITAKYPHITIYMLSPIFKWAMTGREEVNSDLFAPNGVYLYEIAEAIGEQAKKWHMPFKDMYNESGINAVNWEYFIPDGVHPSAEGHKRLTHVIKGFITNN